MYELALFAGAGGGILGGRLNGWRCVGAVECEKYPRGVLCARQNDGCLEPFPIWSDVRSFTTRNNACRRYIRWLRSIRRELVISGGFPCQDISAAGRGAGITGERSGLWREFARIIGEIRPRHVLVENSPVLTSRGLGTVCGDLAALGYDAEWGVLGAADAIWRDGDPVTDHERNRLWIWATMPDAPCSGQRGERLSAERALEARTRHGESATRFCAESANADGAGCSRADVSQSARRECEAESVRTGDEAADTDTHGMQAGISTQGPREKGKTEIADNSDLRATAGNTGRERCEALGSGHYSGDDRAEFTSTSWWSFEPDVGRVADGVAHRVGQLRALGNGQVAAVVRLAWEKLGSGNFEE